MSVNCINCIVRKRTGFDLLCDRCRESHFKECHYYDPDEESFGECPITLSDEHVKENSICSFCPWFKFLEIPKANKDNPPDPIKEKV